MDPAAEPTPKRVRREEPEVLEPVAAEVANLCHFLLAQLRWEYGDVISTEPAESPSRFAPFDAHLAAIDGEHHGRDVQAMGQ